MKKTILGLGVMMFAAVSAVSCGNSADKNSAPQKNVSKGTAAAVGVLPNYRFVNLDTISVKYNLAIDFNEQMIRLQNGLAEEEKRQQTLAQNKLAALEQKAQAAQQLTDPNAMRAQLESIQREYDNIQRNAQQKMAEAGMNAEKTIADNSKTLQDSLTNFLRDYAEQRGYDAVLVNSAAPYYNPALDVTDEVVEGLNARYNKVKN